MYTNCAMPIKSEEEKKGYLQNCLMPIKSEKIEVFRHAVARYVLARTKVQKA